MYAIDVFQNVCFIKNVDLSNIPLYFSGNIYMGFSVYQWAGCLLSIKTYIVFKSRNE